MKTLDASTNTLASPNASLPVPNTAQLDDRSVRARAESMAVLALGDGLYEVEAESGETYLVDLAAGRCTCPDHVFRGVRCKHVRRVAIEITEGRTPPPGQVAVPCVDCGDRVFLEADDPVVERDGPAYCDAHTIAPGDRVRDRETDGILTVIDVTDRRADAVRIRARQGATTVAEYPTNELYADDVPVVGAVYPHARVAANGPVPASLRVYVFPRTRLERVADR